MSFAITPIALTMAASTSCGMNLERSFYFAFHFITVIIRLSFLISGLKKKVSNVLYAYIALYREVYFVLIWRGSSHTCVDDHVHVSNPK
jgi:hypothetical protein